MNKVHRQSAISEVMVISVVLSAIVMTIGMAYFLFYHWKDVPGDHIFQREPLRFRKPLDIFFSPIEGHDQSFNQLGVLFLLLNPFLRIAVSWLGYVFEKDVLYVAICTIVLCALGISFFV